MKKFSGYAETEVHEFIQYDKLNLGPHYCKITDVREISSQGQTGPYSYLQINFDTTDKDEQPQFYSKRFKQEVDQDAQTAKWRGIYRDKLLAKSIKKIQRGHWRIRTVSRIY